MFRQNHSSSASSRNQRVCRHYQNGYCRYGADCRFLHPQTVTKVDDSSSSDEEDNQPPQVARIGYARALPPEDIQFIGYAVSAFVIDDEPKYAPKDQWKAQCNFDKCNVSHANEKEIINCEHYHSKDELRKYSKRFCGIWDEKGFCTKKGCKFSHPLSDELSQLQSTLVKLDDISLKKVFSSLPGDKLQDLRSVIPFRPKKVCLLKECFGKNVKYSVKFDNNFFKNLTGKQVVSECYRQLRLRKGSVLQAASFQEQMLNLRTYIDELPHKARLAFGPKFNELKTILHHAHHNSSYDIVSVGEISKDDMIVVVMSDIEDLFSALLGPNVVISIDRMR